VVVRTGGILRRHVIGEQGREDNNGRNNQWELGDY
jgi:hypothetical protein